MTLRAALRGFMAAPWRRKSLAVEAFADLVFAALVTRLPARRYASQLGDLQREVADSAPGAPDPAHLRDAAEIGRTVSSVARHLPFRALCLQQAIAVRRMLRRRGITAEVRLGVDPVRVAAMARSPGTAAAACKTGDGAAHAWVLLGDEVICGALSGLSRYAVVGRFR